MNKPTPSAGYSIGIIILRAERKATNVMFPDNVGNLIAQGLGDLYQFKYTKNIFEDYFEEWLFAE